MPLILGDHRLDLRQFKDLVPERFRIVACESLPATPTMIRLQRNRFGHLARRHECSLMFLVPFLSAAFSLRFRFGFGSLGVRMLAGGRQRRVLRSHAKPRFQVLNPGFIIIDNRPDELLHIGRQPSKLFFRDRRSIRSLRHTRGVAENHVYGKTNSPPNPDRGVNGYTLGTATAAARDPVKLFIDAVDEIIESDLLFSLFR